MAKQKQHDRKNISSSTTQPTTSLSTLPEILQSFGIIVKTKAHFHDLNKSASLESKFQELFMDKKNNQLVTEGEKEGFDQYLKDGYLFSNKENEYSVNIKRSKILIRFKCEFDHMRVVNHVKFKKSSGHSMELTNKKLHDIEERANLMYIDIDVKFNSIVELTKYLNISDCKHVDVMLEDAILSKFVEILDVDHKKKQVYIKLNTFDTNSTSNLCNYLLMGKIDGTDKCFILDFTRDFHKDVKTVDGIYKFYTPNFMKNVCFNNKSTFHERKEIGLHRVLIGSFFYCHSNWTYDPINMEKRIVELDEFFRVNSLQNIDIVDPASLGMLFTQKNTYMYISGYIHAGFYTFEMKGLFRYHLQDMPFRREFYHFSL